MDGHDINLVKSLGAIWTFPHTILHAVFDTLKAEYMTASFKGGILEPILANSAKSKLLLSISLVK